MGISLANAFHRHMLRSIMRDMGITPEKLKTMRDNLLEDIRVQDPKAYAEIMKNIQEDRPVIKIRLEQHQGILFAYREDDSSFLGQGNNKDDLIKSIGHRLKNVTIEITNGELLQENNA